MKRGCQISKKINGQAGFTLMELLIVVGIIGILVAIAIPTFGGAVEKAKEATCSANRRAAYAEISYAKMKNPNADLQGILSSYQNACPDHGTYRLTTGAAGQISIACSVHAADVAEELLNGYRNLAENYKTDPDYGYPYYSNDKFREYFYKKMGGWPTLTYQKNAYYIQPYGLEDQGVFNFANGNSTTSSNWNANLLYSGGVWYYKRNSFGFWNKTAEDVAKIVLEDGWKALNPKDYTIEMPKTAP